MVVSVPNVMLFSNVVRASTEPENICRVDATRSANQSRRSSTQKYTYKLVDFGLACSAGNNVSDDQPSDDDCDSDDETEPHPTMESKTMMTLDVRLSGTPHYMSPERHKGIDDVGADLWAVGVLMFELVSLQLPFGGNASAWGVVTELVNGEAATRLDAFSRTAGVARPKVSKEYADLVARSLMKDQRRRFESASTMLDALKDLATKRIFVRENQQPVAFFPLKEESQHHAFFISKGSQFQSVSESTLDDEVVFMSHCLSDQVVGLKLFAQEEGNALRGQCSHLEEISQSGAVLLFMCHHTFETAHVLAQLVAALGRYNKKVILVHDLTFRQDAEIWENPDACGSEGPSGFRKVESEDSGETQISMKELRSQCHAFQERLCSFSFGHGFSEKECQAAADGLEALFSPDGLKNSLIWHAAEPFHEVSVQQIVTRLGVAHGLLTADETVQLQGHDSVSPQLPELGEIKKHHIYLAYHQYARLVCETMEQFMPGVVIHCSSQSPPLVADGSSDPPETTKSSGSIPDEDYAALVGSLAIVVYVVEGSLQFWCTEQELLTAHAHNLNVIYLHEQDPAMGAVALGWEAQHA